MRQKITYYKRHHVGAFAVIDEPCEAYVMGEAFTSGSLHYFRLDAFNYLVLTKNNKGEWMEA